METASLYCNSNNMSKVDMDWMLRAISPQMNWSAQSELVLDIGSGPGNTTRETMWPWLGSALQSKSLVLGVDLTEAMVRYSNTFYATVDAVKENSPNFQAVFPRIQGTRGVAFAQLDFNQELDEGPWMGQFTKILSAFTLQQLRNQTTVHTNIFRLLRSGGESALLFLAQQPYFKALEKLINEGKYQDILYDFDSFLPPFYKYEENQALKMEQVLREIGFEVKMCEVRPFHFTFDSEQALRQLYTSVLDRFWSRLDSREKQDKFMDDVFQRMLEYNKNELGVKDPLTIGYKLFLVHARKP